jgi:GTPase Era involved in 16S rRNA processing
VDQVVYVGHARHKQMVVGRGGQVLSWLRDRTQRDLAALLGARIDLRVEVLIEKRAQDLQYHDQS